MNSDLHMLMWRDKIGGLGLSYDDVLDMDVADREHWVKWYKGTRDAIVKEMKRKP